MLKEIYLRKIQDFGSLNLRSGLIHNLAGSFDVIALEDAESSVLHADISDSLWLSLSKRTLECFKEKVLRLLSVVHAALKCNICDYALDVARHYVYY